MCLFHLNQPPRTNIWLATACLLASAGFLQFDELVQLRPYDIQVSASMTKLRISQSKIDPLRRGDKLFIAQTGTPTCPIAILERYMAEASIDPKSDLYLSQAITKTKKREVLRSSGSLSYSGLSEIVKCKLEDLGYPAVNFRFA